MKTLFKRLMVIFLYCLLVGISASASTNYSTEDFIIEVTVNNSPDSFSITTKDDYEYNYAIDCENDDSFDDINITGDYTCNYANAGTYRIVIAHKFPSFGIENGDAYKLQSVNQWGTGKWKSMNSAFYRVPNLTVNASDSPDLSEVLSMSNMFNSVTELTFMNSINSWDVSNVENMYAMFALTEDFNEDIGDWNVSNVTDMRNMFYYATSFNQDIGNWDISNVVLIYSMFEGATYFNQDIGDWNISKVEDIQDMFKDAISFNQDIGDWNPASINWPSWMTDMFLNAHLSVGNYDSLLISWSKLNLINDVEFNAGSTSKFCRGIDARDQIISEDNWTFIDDDVTDCSFFILTSNEVSIENAKTYVLDIDTTNLSTEYSIVGGTDGDKFTVSQDGVLEFIDAPDFNNPTDSNYNNIYRVQVKAVSGGYTDDYQTIKVTVEPSNNSVIVPTIIYLLD